MDEALLREAIVWVTRAVEIAGILIILIGAAVALVRFLIGRTGGERRDRIACFRSDLGRGILLGLEFLVAADIINTVAIEPTLDSVIVLAGIVLIRTFLSWSLEVEIEGRWPWQRAAAEAREVAPRN
jgi:uncharacterized membrane protein